MYNCNVYRYDVYIKMYYDDSSLLQLHYKIWGSHSGINAKSRSLLYATIYIGIQQHFTGTWCLNLKGSHKRVCWITLKMWAESSFSMLITSHQTSAHHILNPLNPELNPLCYLLALLGAHHFLHISRIRVKSLTFRLLMSYIYGAPILDVSRWHTTTQHSR